MTDYSDIIRRLRGKYPLGPIKENGEPEFGWREFSPIAPIQLEAADAIEALEKERDEARAAWKKSHRDGYSFYELYRDAKARVAELEKERDRYHDALVARHGGEPIALLSELDEARARIAELETVLRAWLQIGDAGTRALARLEDAERKAARVAELEKERDEARRSDAESLELYRRSRERLEARVAEMERLIRHRCEIYCAKDYIPRDMHAPDCLVEEAGIK